jgi:hypothetical protein
MGRKKKSEPSADQPDWTPNPLLERAKAEAAAGKVPTPHQEEKEQIPMLLELLTPSEWPDPNHKGSEPRLIWREPLLLISWDKRAAAWKVNLSDSVLEVSGGCLASSLLTALIDAERALGNGGWSWSERGKKKG